MKEKKMNRVSIIDAMLKEKKHDSKQIMDAVIGKLNLSAEDKVLRGRIRSLIYVRKAMLKKAGIDHDLVKRDLKKIVKATNVKKTKVAKKETVKEEKREV